MYNALFQKKPCESVNREDVDSVVFVESRKQTKEDLEVQLRKQQSKKVAAQILSRAKTSEKTRRLSRLGAGYDPFAPIDAAKNKAVTEFFKRLPNWPSRHAKKYPVNHWWWLLRTPQQWLADTHMDAVINLLRRRFMEHPQWFRSDRICLLDTILSMMWRTKYADFLATEPNPDGSGRQLPPGAFDYYTGETPVYCKTGKTWGVDVDDIYTPLNVKDDHWVALCISIPQRHILIWDSLVHHSSAAEIAKAVEPLAVMLPYLLREMAIREERYKFPYDAFTHTRLEAKEVPQQGPGGDCGVYCLKFIEYHALGLPFPPSLCPANMKVIRQKLVVDIHQETKCHGPPNQDWANMGLYEGT